MTPSTTPPTSLPPADSDTQEGAGGVPVTPDTVIESYYANYTEYSKTLRTWLVAYGIGGPVLFLTNEAASSKFVASGDARCIVTLFLFGVVFQVFGTAVNKWAAWHVYSDMTDPARAKGWWSHFWSWVNKQAWIDVAVDVGSIVAFGKATWMLLDVFVAAAKAAGTAE